MSDARCASPETVPEGARLQGRRPRATTATGDPPARPPQRAVARQALKRERIVRAAMEHFAADGYEGARVEDIASDAGVSKGTVFAYFDSKPGLFLAAYEAATRHFDAYLEAPPSIVEAGFFAILQYWLEHTTHLIQDSWIPYRVALVGNYCSDLRLRREITQFLLREDPFGTRAFVQFGIERGEVRSDIDAKMIVSLVDWLMDRCQDAIVSEELDPGLFGGNTQSPEGLRERYRQFLELVRGAIGSPAAPAAEPSPSRAGVTSVSGVAGRSGPGS